MLLKTEAVCKEFAREGRTFTALDGIDFELHQGEFVHIVGRSGSGKTTFMNLLAGLLLPTSGKVTYKDQDITSWNDEEISRYRGKEIGVIPQHMGTLPNLNVLENVALPHYLAGGTVPVEDRAHMLLEMLEIEHLKNQFPRQLSGGEIRRVMVARALMNEPSIIMADEPTADLDSQSSTNLMKIFKKLNDEGITFMVITHEQDNLKYGSRVLELAKGKWVD